MNIFDFNGYYSDEMGRIVEDVRSQIIPDGKRMHADPGAVRSVYIAPNRQMLHGGILSKAETRRRSP